MSALYMITTALRYFAVSKLYRKRADHFAVSVGFVMTVWVGAVSRWIVKDAVVPWDLKNQFYAFFRFLSATLRAGDWPFWNPYHYGGHPSVSRPAIIGLSPVFVAWGALDPAPTMRAFDLIVLAHLLAGGIAMAAIGWRARWPIPGCVLTAVLYMFGGAASARLQHTGIILSYSVFPLALLLLQLALERRSHLLAITFAIAAVSVALGRNQVAFLLCLLLSLPPRPKYWVRTASALSARANRRVDDDGDCLRHIIDRAYAADAAVRSSFEPAQRAS